MAKRRAGVGLAALNGYLYAVGGFDDASPLETVERLVGVVWCGRGLPGSSGCWFVLVALQHFLYTIKVCLSLSLSFYVFLMYYMFMCIHCVWVTV